MPRSTASESVIEGSDDFQKFVRSYIALKAAFTRVENQNIRLVEYAPTVASATTLDQLQKALSKLEDQYVKLESIKDNIIDECDSDDQLEKLKLEDYSDHLGERYEANRSLLLDAIKVVGAKPQERIVENRNPNGNSTGGCKLVVNKSLKPFNLLQSHDPTEFKNWCRLFRGYFRSSNLDLLEVPDQQFYFQACMEPGPVSYTHLTLPTNREV